MNDIDATWMCQEVWVVSCECTHTHTHPLINSHSQIANVVECRKENLASARHAWHLNTRRGACHLLHILLLDDANDLDALWMRREFAASLLLGERTGWHFSFP